MNRARKKYEELEITDDFMFGKVMRNPKHCRKMLEIILGVPIGRIVFLDDQMSLNPDYDAKGIRLDIFLEDEGRTVYNVEIQTDDTGELPKRSRYYQSVLDINMIEKGEKHAALKKSFIIFICTFDLFGQGRPVYHFENLCREDTSLRLGDETEKIFLNTKGRLENADEDLRNLLQYFESFVPQDAYTEELDAAVAEAKLHKEWRRDYMKFELMMMDARWEGREEGREEGSLLHLIQLVCRKLKKEKLPETIAEELDEDIDAVRRICEVAKQYAPDYDCEKILEELL